MKRAVTGLAIFLIVVMPANADLGSSTYKLAANAYETGGCDTAQPLLMQYQLEDATFLSANPEIGHRVRSAIEWCGWSMVAAHPVEGVQIRLPPRPAL